MRYFQNTHQYGQSHWALWVFVFWLTVIGWITANLIFSSPIDSIIQAQDPELAAAYNAAANALYAEADAQILLWAGRGFGITLLTGLIFGFLALSRPVGERFPLALPAGISIAISFVCLGLLAPMMNSAETTQLLNRILAASPLVYTLILLVFPASLILLYVGQKFILRRSLLSLHTAWQKFRWKRVFQSVFITWGILALIGFILSQLGLREIKMSFDAERFFIYALISLSLIPLQSATEEIIFRGYLNQALENILRNKWIAFVITSVMFMALHLANPEALSGAEKGVLPLVMSSYFFFGFACCLMVWMDDGLESAIGVHAGNNLFAAIFVNYENSVLPTPSLFQIQSESLLDPLIIIVTLCVILAALFYTRTKPLVPEV